MIPLTFQTSAIAIAQIFAMGAMGFYLLRSGLVQESGLRLLSILSINIFFPLFIFNQMLFHALGEEYIGESKAAELLSCSLTHSHYASCKNNLINWGGTFILTATVCKKSALITAWECDKSHSSRAVTSHAHSKHFPESFEFTVRL